MDGDTGEVYAAGFFRGGWARRMQRMTLAIDPFSRQIAEHEGIPFGMPQPDPTEQDMLALAVARDQPRPGRLIHLAAAAHARGHTLAKAREVSRLIRDGSTDGWDAANTSTRRRAAPAPPEAARRAREAACPSG